MFYLHIKLLKYMLNIVVFTCEDSILIKYRLTNEAPTDLNVTFNN